MTPEDSGPAKVGPAHVCDRGATSERPLCLYAPSCSAGRVRDDGNGACDPAPPGWIDAWHRGLGLSGPRSCDTLITMHGRRSPRMMYLIGLPVCWFHLMACGPDRECDSNFIDPRGGAADGICTKQPGTYKYCESSGGGQFSTSAASTRWVTEKCPGLEPVCEPLHRAGLDTGHTCQDAFEGQPCDVVELLPSAAASGLYSRDEMLLSDIDFDGDLDLLFLADRSEEGDSTLWLSVQSGAGQFAESTLLAEYDSAIAYRLRAGQIDGRGWRDVAVWMGRTDITLLFPDRDPERTSSEVSIDGFADLDGDGVDEAVVDSDAELEIHRDLLGPSHDVQVVETGTESWLGIRADDVDADEDIDLIVGSPMTRALLVVSDGGLEPIWTGSAVVADFDGNGVADAASRDVVNMDVGTGSTGRALQFRDTAYRGFRYVGDVNGDTNLDLVEPLYRPGSHEPPNQRISVFLGDGTGQLADPVIYDMADYVVAFGLADIDGDGRADLIAADEDGAVFYAPGTCQGT